jgi:hypothetical protein
MKHPQILPKALTQKLSRNLHSITFEIILTHKYPYLAPQVVCLTPFAPQILSLCDGRDLFDEITGREGW